MTSIKCKYCREEFEPDSQNRSKKNAQLFCGKRCQQKHWEDLNPRVKLDELRYFLRSVDRPMTAQEVLKAIAGYTVKGRNRSNRTSGKEKGNGGILQTLFN